MRLWTSIVLIGLLALLVACNVPAGGTPTPTGTPLDQEGEIMMTPTPENTPDPSPVPSAEVTPDAPATQTAQGTLCSLSQSGGFAGIVELLEVTESGAVTLTRERPPAEPMTTQASEEQLSALRAAIESDEWQQLPFEIGSPVPDGFTYEIRCGNKTVTTYDGAERPAVLNEVLEQLGALRQQAVGQ